MILQALEAYYQRKCADPDPAQHLPAFGLERKEIPYILEINQAGCLVRIRDTQEAVGKKKIAQSFLVPQGAKKASGVSANLLWDTVEYVLGIDTRGKPERVVEQHTAFIARINALPDGARNDIGVQAVLSFLANDPKAQCAVEAVWLDMVENNPVVSFALSDDAGLVCQRPAVISAFAGLAEEAEQSSGMCLVTGREAPIERLHAAIKNVWGAQTSGANIVSFNKRAFESYGKTERQGENAPVSKAASFAYTTALNHLLHKNSPQRLQVGDASTVFWADSPSELETSLVDIFGEPTKDDPDRNVRAVKALYQSVHLGQMPVSEGNNRFHVLGLAPNAARISIRFYHCLPLVELGERVLAHFEDINVIRGKNDPEYPSIFRLLTSVAVQGKADNIPPNLGGGVMDAILAGPGATYPSLWLNAAVNRCRSEHVVPYLRAAIIKACLNRQIRRHPDHHEKEFQPMLDLANANVAYRLGRLFAALEKIQEEASPGLNATIRDRYYGAASSTPVAVFTTLLRLKNAHLKKLPTGRAVWFEKMLGDVLDEVCDFPAHLPLADQGRFALGYYHQRQAFFQKNQTTEKTSEGN
ncbi:MAG: hypothetical protein RIR70_2087 [Pseudomonadota bacterium]|jgi:CRISPR-associated protein Csd1